MTKQDALVATLEHWQENLCYVEEGNMDKFSFAEKDCALCGKYHKTWDPQALPCHGCPLKSVSWCFDADSLYRDVVANRFNEGEFKWVLIEKILDLVEALEWLRDNPVKY